MTEQHEWMWNNDSMIPFVCKEPDCRRFLDRQQSVSRLNEYETLKRATEALTAFLRQVKAMMAERYQPHVIARQIDDILKDG